MYIKLITLQLLLAALEAVEDQIEVDRSSIETGLKTALLSGRFQKIQSKPEIIVDVGHNPHAAVQLAETLKANPIGGKPMQSLECFLTKTEKRFAPL